MEIKEIRNGNVTVLDINGRLDSVTACTLEKKLSDDLTEEDKNLIFDFSGMEYISSAGLRVLLTAAKRADKLGAKAVFSGLTPCVREVFDIVGFASIFDIYKSREEAEKALCRATEP